MHKETNIQSEENNIQNTEANSIGFNKLSGHLVSNLPAMVEELKNEFIQKNVDLATIKKFFLNGPKTKIEWLGSLQSLNYFIRQLCILTLNDSKMYERGFNCFNHADENYSVENLRSSKDINETDKQKIDAVIKKLKGQAIKPIKGHF
jgi:hypothetical protein